MARRRRQGLRITPLGYVVLGLIVVVMLVGVYFIIWSLTGNKDQQGQGNILSSSVNFTPTPTMSPAPGVTPTPSLPPTQAPTLAPTAPPETPTPTPKLDDTPQPDVKTPSPSQVESAVDGQTTAKLNLRGGPGTQFNVLGTYSIGTRLKVYALENDFYFVMVVAENAYGYMSAEYVEKEGLLPGETLTPAPNLPDGAVAGTVSASVVALRNQPSTEGNTPFGQIERGIQVYVYYETDGFYYIEVAGTGTKGYAKAEFIAVEDPVPERTPNP